MLRMSVFVHQGVTHTGGMPRSGLRYWLIAALALHGMLLILVVGHPGAPVTAQPQALVVSLVEPAKHAAVTSVPAPAPRRAASPSPVSMPTVANVVHDPSFTPDSGTASVEPVPADPVASPELARDEHAPAPLPAVAPITPDGYLALVDLLREAIDRHKRYPRLAETRAWEGTASISFELQHDGRLAALTLARSSGHAVLDRAALAAVTGIAPFTRAAEYLAEAQPFTIDIIFTLSGD
jgi:periplasmic protein TonB